ncbi:hypothetical protein BsIDN1_37440 [Bacillus safensis]|uniref:Uncharacterized protein n=1 Tax=Bacillus safensis TaxID=561879 RepID=A0A5S9MEX2_BACIA|nr:hypothetical protein BsIDN1_37440 [Bacillus safensis]
MANGWLKTPINMALSSVIQKEKKTLRNTNMSRGICAMWEKEAAKAMHDHDLTFEEYMNKVKKI